MSKAKQALAKTEELPPLTPNRNSPRCEHPKDARRHSSNSVSLFRSPRARSRNSSGVEGDRAQTLHLGSFVAARAGNRGRGRRWRAGVCRHAPHLWDKIVITAPEWRRDPNWRVEGGLAVVKPIPRHLYVGTS